jgi:glycosyltransferase involved in cell wall biosynthesis
VVLAGFQPHDVLRRIYASSDVFAFPSATECFANVVVEAMASGLPVLVSDGGGARQHVACSGSDGVIVSERTGEAWAAMIRDLVGDEARRAAIGRRARERVVARYPSWKAVMAEVVRPGWLSAAAAWHVRRSQPLARRPWVPSRTFSRA